MMSSDMAIETFDPYGKILEQHGFINSILRSIQTATSGIRIPTYVDALRECRFQGSTLSVFGGTPRSFAIKSSPNEIINLLSSKMGVTSSYPFTKIQENSCIKNRIFPGVMAATSNMKGFLYLGAYKKGNFQGPILSAVGGNNQYSATKSSSRGNESRMEGWGWIGLYILKLYRITMTAPLDRIQLLLQNQNEMVKSGQLSKPYKGIVDCYDRTMKTDGLFSLWRGNAVNIAAILSCEVIRYSASHWINSVFKFDQKKDCCLTWFSGFLGGVAPSNDATKRVHHYDQNKVGYWKWFAGFHTGSAVANAVIISIVHPLIYAHTRWAGDVKNDVGKRQFSSLRDVFIKTIRSEGVVGLYRGLSVSLIYTYLAVGLTSVAYVYTRPDQMVVGLEMPHRIYAWGALTKVLELCTMLAIYPLDTIRRRMMMTCGQETKYETAFDAVSKIVKQESFRSLYKGASAGLLNFVLKCSLTYTVIYVWLEQEHERKRKKLNTDEAKTALQKNTTDGDNTALQKKTDDDKKSSVSIRFKF